MDTHYAAIDVGMVLTEVMDPVWPGRENGAGEMKASELIMSAGPLRRTPWFARML